MYIVIVQKLEKHVFQNHYKYLLLADIPNSTYILESSLVHVSYIKYKENIFYCSNHNVINWITICNN